VRIGSRRALARNKGRAYLVSSRVNGLPAVVGSNQAAATKSSFARMSSENLATIRIDKSEATTPKQVDIEILPAA
jgi:hypothetical protein